MWPAWHLLASWVWSAQHDRFLWGLLRCPSVSDAWTHTPRVQALVQTHVLSSLQGGRMMTACAGLAVRVVCSTHVHLGCCERYLSFVRCVLFLTQDACLVKGL